MHMGEKVAYLKGLAEGLELDGESKNGRMIKGILEVLESMAEVVDELQEDTENISDYVEDLDEDLGDVEEFVYGKKSMSCPSCNHKHKAHDKADEDDEIDLYDDDVELDEPVEIKCPMCGDDIVIELDVLLDNDVIVCPNCNKKLTVIDDSGECGCCCEGHSHGEDSDEYIDIELDEQSNTAESEAE